MEYYLVRFSYTAAAWKELLDNTRSLEQRLAPVRRLIKQFRGSLATFHFYEAPHFDDAEMPPVVVREKMVLFGEYDLLGVIAMPNKHVAQAFRMAISAEPGLKAVELLSMMPLEEAIAAMPDAQVAVQKSRYAAPGQRAS